MQVFLGVSLFGLFHGLVYLPIMLSLVGPAPYLWVKNRRKQKAPNRSTQPAAEEDTDRRMVNGFPFEFYSNQRPTPLSATPVSMTPGSVTPVTLTPVPGTPEPGTPAPELAEEELGIDMPEEPEAEMAEPEVDQPDVMPRRHEPGTAIAQVSAEESSCVYHDKSAKFKGLEDETSDLTNLARASVSPDLRILRFRRKQINLWS